MAAEITGQLLWAGEYEIQGELATGGMATVYRAHAQSLDTTVAVKVLSARFAQDPSFKKRFHGEATSIAALHHPNIIEVYHFGEENAVPYIAMRFVPGGTLKERVQELGGMMNLRSASRLIAQVASALQYAHEAGMIHLDVKPANILLGSADWPLLSDFGIIRIAGDAREDGHRIAGTPAYMSPEQWQGLEIDGRSDEYSLGLTFYELVTGRRPFSGETSAELKEQHLRESPPRPRELNPGIPGPVEDVILRAIEKNPDDRYQTIGAFGTALVEAVERSRGMQLETKQALVGSVPNMVALLVLSVVGPLLAGLPDPNLPLYRNVTLNWPIALLIALLQAGLLMGIRWHLIGIATRLLGAAVDGLDRFARTYVKQRAGSGGPLRVATWRNAAVGSAQGIVNIAYLFVVYRIVATPLTMTAALPFGAKFQILFATGVTALVFLIAAWIVLNIFRTSGPIVAVLALAICWGLVSTLPMLDERIYGDLSVQWLAKLLIGLAVLAAFLVVRARVQRAARELIVPIIDQPVAGLQQRRTREQGAAQRQGIERASDGIVNVAYLVVGYPIIALPLRNVLEAFVSEDMAGIMITLGVVLAAALLINKARLAAGAVPAALGLLISAPTLMGLPVFATDGALGSASMRWTASIMIAIGVLAIFLGVRQRIQSTARQILVPAIDQQLGSLLTAGNEEQAAAQRQALGGLSDTLVDLLYLLIGYITVVSPVAGAVAGALNLTWVSVVIYALFVLFVLSVLFGFARRLLPTLRPAATTVTAATPVATA